MDVIQSMAVIPNSPENFDEVWVSVERENGVFIERMSARVIARECSGDINALIEDQIRLDSCVSYDTTIEIDEIAQGASTTVTTTSPHGLSSGDIVSLQCAGDFDGRFEVEAVASACDDAVLLALEFEASDGTTTLDDLSCNNWTVDIDSTLVEIDTANKKIGNASLLLTGTYAHVIADDHIRITSTSSIGPTSNRTHKCWFYLETLPGERVGDWVYFFREGYIISGGSSYNMIRLVSDDSGVTVKFQLLVGDGATNSAVETEDFTLTKNAWHHFEFTMEPLSGGIYPVHFFIDGTEIPMVTGQEGPAINGNRPDNKSYIGDHLDGWIDGYRITNTLGHTSDFTPSTTPYSPVSATTSFRILHAELGSPIDSSTFTAFEGPGYVRLGSTTFEGLDHLEGETVGILADGTALDEQVVSGGSVTTSTAYGLVHIGLKYNCDVETLDIAIADEEGSIQANKIKVGNVVMRFADSRGGQIGPNENDLYEAFTDLVVRQNSSELIMNPLGYDWGAQDISDPLPYTFTGDIRKPLGAGYTKGGRLFFRQGQPYPTNLLSVVPEILVGKAV